MWRWRESSQLQSWAVERWEPRWSAKSEGLGVQVGRQAVGVGFDPLNQTILVVTTDIDRVLSGYFRVDPYLNEVVERRPLSPPSTRTSLPIDRWYERWQFDLSADRSTAVLALPSRLWSLDLKTGKQSLLASLQGVEAVAISPANRSGKHLVAAATKASIALYGAGETRYLPIPAPVLTIQFTPMGLVAITVEGKSSDTSRRPSKLIHSGKRAAMNSHARPVFRTVVTKYS